MRKLMFTLASVGVVFLCVGVAQADVAPGAGQAGYSLFEQMDQNGDGSVSQSEFQAYNLGEQDKTQLFSVIDQNKDGTISESEWQAYQAGGVQQPRAAEEPMAAEEPQKERKFSGDVWDEQTYDVNDPRKIEPKDRGTTTDK